MDGDRLCLSHVVERDMDLLLVEELTCSAPFLCWFVGQVEPAWASAHLSDVHVRHSVSGSGPGSGETDIELALMIDGIKVLFLLEDKIHSPFTEHQPDRYRLRAQARQAAGRCGHSRCVLLCPAGFVPAETAGFDRLVSYEQIASFLSERATTSTGELAARLAYRSQIVLQAIGRFRRGYAPNPVAEVTGLWQIYYQIASQEFPALEMPSPGPKPGDSYSVTFHGVPRRPPLPKCRIEHVMERGTVTLTVPGHGGESDRIGQVLGSTLPPGAYIRAAGKSLGVTIKVAEIRRLQPAGDQIGAIREAMVAATQLQAWYNRHWQELVRALSAQGGPHAVS